MTEFRQNADDVTYDHLKGRLNAEDFLDSLGIIISHPKGKNLMCHCPDVWSNHKNGDANPSFGFQTDELIYNCYVCGGGNILDLVRWVTPIDSDEDALLYCQQYSDMSIENEDALYDRIQMLLHPTSEVTMLPQYPPESLFQYRFIHPYLLERGISEDVIKQMQVGFDEHHLGIVIPHFYSHKLVGYQVRHLAEISGVYHCKMCEPYHPTGKIPKYKNTGDFPKQTTLYNYDNVVELNPEFVIVVESPMTALYLMSHGYPNVVATFGSFSDAQMILLVRFPRILIWADNDPAGNKNALGKKKGKHGKREPGPVQALKPFTDVFIVPLVDKEKGDGNDVASDKLECYISAAFPAALLPLYGCLPTLEQVLANT